MTLSEPLLVDCGPHGKRVAAVVCQHLLRTDPAPVGFVENSSDPEDFQAWCTLCEEVFQREGGMTDAFLEFNDRAIVCVVCYDEARVRHSPRVS